MVSNKGLGDYFAFTYHSSCITMHLHTSRLRNITLLEKCILVFITTSITNVLYLENTFYLEIINDIVNAYCMFSNSTTLVASVWVHILHVYLRAWYMRDGISLKLGTTEPVLLIDGV